MQAANERCEVRRIWWELTLTSSTVAPQATSFEVLLETHVDAYTTLRKELHNMSGCVTYPGPRKRECFHSKKC